MSARDIVFLFTDIEADGPVPGLYSMISFGTVATDIEGNILDEFEANLKPLPEASQYEATMDWWANIPEAWVATQINQQDPADLIPRYIQWVDDFGKIPVLAAHPAFFDAMFMWWYCLKYTGRRVFHGSALDLQSLVHGIFGGDFVDASRLSWPEDWLGGVEHNHKAIDDARGYANAYRKIRQISKDAKRCESLDGILEKLLRYR